MTPQWKERFTKESLILVFCLIYGLLLPLNLLLLSLIPLFLTPGLIGGPTDESTMRYVQFLHGLTTLTRCPLSNGLGWALFLAPYPLYQLARSIIWGIKARRATQIAPPQIH